MEILGVQLHKRDVMLQLQQHMLASPALKDGGLQAQAILHARHAQQEDIQINNFVPRMMNALLVWLENTPAWLESPRQRIAHHA